MWKFSAAPSFAVRLKQWGTSFPEETRDIFNHLHTVFGLLNRGLRPNRIPNVIALVREEQESLFVIEPCKTHKKIKLNDAKIYFHPEPTTQIIHVITIGDEQTRLADMDLARHFVEVLRNGPLTQTVK